MDKKYITVLTGAGISAESGIPTFRGPEGYWTVGSSNYHPQDMATHAMFMRDPDEVWKWYLYRLSVYRHARPNPGHLALVEMERLLQDRFTLITQNIDNLHLLAGNSPTRTLQIHGNIYRMRCSVDCQGKTWPLPLALIPREKDQPISPSDRQHLSCPDCGSMTRPHVLWFDECYDEQNFHFDTALAVAARTEVLIIAGTSGATTLPNLVANIVRKNHGTVIDINIQESPFTEMALTSVNGRFINKTCTEGLAEILEIITAEVNNYREGV